MAEERSYRRIFREVNVYIFLQRLPGLCGKKQSLSSLPVLLERQDWSTSLDLTMVHSCCVINCTARWSGDKGFFRLPSENDKERRKKWLRNIPRADPEDDRKPWIPSNTDRICKNDFVTGKLICVRWNSFDFNFPCILIFSFLAFLCN